MTDMEKRWTLLSVVITMKVLTCYAQADCLKFDIEKYRVQKLNCSGKEFTVRAYEGITYVKNPVDTVCHRMNIYIPEEYFNGKSINGFTAGTAPIFYPNQVGGYMPALPASTTGKRFMPPMKGGGGFGERPPLNIGENSEKKPPMDFPKESEANSVVMALSHGYIVASAGARGRSNKDATGKYYGKAPAGLIDLKAGIRYLKYNDAIMPGDANKIISNGTSAGGAMSALLGATGDNPDYLPYLKEIGAAETSDAVFATSAYCPITNLDNADMAYEWQFWGINTFRKGGPFGPGPDAAEVALTDYQIQVSSDLDKMFPAYLNSLKLKDQDGNLLTLDRQGEGNFKEYIKRQILISANKALKNGTDLSDKKWLTIVNGKAAQINWPEFLKYLERQKTPPAFDALDLSSPENIEFGTKTIAAQHFTEYAMQHNTIPNATQADKNIVKMMNPMYYIGAPNTKVAPFWRIQHGSKDKDAGFAISAMLTLKLQNSGFNVDYLLPWDVPHSGDYDLPELFEWIDKISK